ncbi:F-box-like domain superfamily [Arabidopsis thaliana x Arabidopsis arenosa]|uniref:F-box-like domain superfamily n=1 Tax=Arabidopsis thaliana x Arabidopsis arenosa TaxID=1240361 RepID=A0A8T2AXK8_9BRAS|nr:F-box-like domain superfamily [Arabidopsis thaliana x Arabidopsis arenosa]
MLSDLPRDLAEDVLVRLPMTSMRAVRLVCKNWNTLFKDESFTKHIVQTKAAAAAMDFLAVMVMNDRVYLMSVNLHGIDPSINHLGKLVSLTDSAQVDISVVYHCDGLLLCITRDLTRFVVWNPYCGQTRWFEPISRQSWDIYAIGYENSKSCRSYKVLRFCELSSKDIRYELYYINSKSPRDMTNPITIFPDWDIQFYARGVSLKGNTYWFAQEMCLGGDKEEGKTRYQDFLISFDFAKERFGPRLSLPFHSFMEETVTLSSVRDEQLAVLFQQDDTLHMEIWITTKIEPEAVSWSKKLLAVDMRPIYDFPIGDIAGSFFVDEEKKVAVVFDIDMRDTYTEMGSYAYIIGEDGYFKKVDLGEPSKEYSFPIMCSYVPGLVQIKRPARGSKRKRREKEKKQIIEYL